MAHLSTWKDLLLGFVRIVRKMARPDWPLALAMLSGLLSGLVAFPWGQAIDDYVSSFAREHNPSTPWLPAEAWAPAMLIAVAILAVLGYLLLRGYQELGIHRGRILGATVTFTCQSGITTAQRAHCEVIVEPRLLGINRPPSPIYVSCLHYSDYRVELKWEPDRKCYRGTCDDKLFHDEVVATMSTSQVGNHAVVAFPGRHFMEVAVMNTNGEIDCLAIAVCSGFRLEHDPVRDGLLLSA